MMNTQGREIPVHKDSRTFEEKRKDLVNSLEKRCGKKCREERCNQTKTPVSETHHNQLATGAWHHELNRWLDDMDKLWSHEWGRVWRSMFSLVPLDQHEMESIPDARGTPKYIPSILTRMDHEMKLLERNIERLIPNYRPEMMEMHCRGHSGVLMPRGGLGTSQLGFLKDAYEPGEDGELQFKLRFDLRGYGPENIRVETDDHCLTVRAQKTENKDGSSRTSEFSRTVYLPDKVEVEKFTSNLTKDGILTVQAPVKLTEVAPIKYGRDHQLGIQPKPLTQNLALKTIGKPGLTVLEDGRIHVEVPVEPEFKIEDLRVSTTENSIVVSGQNEVEEKLGEDGRSWHVREFQRSYPTPQPIDPLSLTAQLVHHTLVVESPMVQKD